MQTLLKTDSHHSQICHITAVSDQFILESFISSQHKHTTFINLSFCSCIFIKPA